jgi:hypothetical protein
MIKFITDNLGWVNLVLNAVTILFVLVYVIRSRRRSVIEGFEGNTIDFEALDSLATIAKGLNAGGAFKFPGDFTVAGKLTVEKDINANESLHFHKSKGVGEGHDLHTTLRLGKSDEKVSDGYYDGSGDFVIDKKDKTKGRIRLDNRAIIVNPATETSSTSRGVTGGATHITLALENKTVENQLGVFNSTRQWGGVGNHLGAHSNGLGVDEW